MSSWFERRRSGVCDGRNNHRFSSQHCLVCKRVNYAQRYRFGYLDRWCVPNWLAADGHPSGGKLQLADRFLGNECYRAAAVQQGTNLVRGGGGPDVEPGCWQQTGFPDQSGGINCFPRYVEQGVMSGTTFPAVARFAVSGTMSLLHAVETQPFPPD